MPSVATNPDAMIVLNDETKSKYSLKALDSPKNAHVN